MSDYDSDEPNARTRLAEDRTVLANERTYSAWVRTGLAALAAGVGFERFLAGAMPDWIVRAVAVILILFSCCAFFLAIWHYTHLGLKLKNAEIRTPPIKSLMLLTLALCLASLLALVGIFITPASG
jgi:putative membrane protein